MSRDNGNKVTPTLDALLRCNSKVKKLLLMESSSFNVSELPAEVKERVDKAIDCGMKNNMGEA